VGTWKPSRRDRQVQEPRAGRWGNPNGKSVNHADPWAEEYGWAREKTRMRPTQEVLGKSARGKKLL